MARTIRTGFCRSTPGSASIASSLVRRDTTPRGSSSARSCGLGGMPVNVKPSHSASMYSMVPPSTMGSLPRAMMSSIASRAPATHCAALNVRAGSTRSIM